MGWGLRVQVEKTFGDDVRQAASLAPLDLRGKSGFLQSHPGLQPLSTGAGEQTCNIKHLRNQPLSTPEGAEGFNDTCTWTFSETDVQMLLLLLNPFKNKEFMG